MVEFSRGRVRANEIEFEFPEDSALVDGVGHFMLVERPEEINRRILDWLGATAR